MSNPAVIVLAKSNNTKERFIVEDNIGESIHLHYGDLRVDMTTNEFLSYEKTIQSSLENLIDIKNFELRYFDPSFIKAIAKFLPDLKKVVFTSIELNKLVIQRKGFFGLPILDSIMNSRVLNALHGDQVENDQFEQVNLLNKTNQDRVKDVHHLVTSQGYPFNNKYIVLFNDQDVIRDGQHRACSLIYNGFDGEIPIIRLVFKDNKYNIPRHPWKVVLINNIKFFIRRTAVKFYGTLKKFI